ncbi:hypothetical protein ACVWWI_003333 [Bradyrhizobium sp. USDA 3686]|uniref:hypothetical protein n=1 Tax=Bradyrhizobium canariense TaxID=255045 RepID=UPI001957ACAF|nr:hypothetical protein [Bradyrhizobium canariense]MBM7483351.1 hypothetical protein [Bradyrhizobium canariense]
MTHVYHFTDTARLPWIIGSGELRPSSNSRRGFPADLLWTTTNPAGDKTASATYAKQLHKDGVIQVVRMTLDADAFGPWREVITGLPGWTEAHLANLEHAAKSAGQDTAAWRCRVAPIRDYDWRDVDAKRHNENWRRIDATQAYCIGHGLRRGFVIAGYAYLATQERDGAGNVSYSNFARAGVTEA